MSPSAFLDRGSTPDEGELEAVLGRASGLWLALRADLASQFAPLETRWSYSGKSHGWLLQLRHKGRTILYLVPCRGYFVASFALSESVCRAAPESGIPGRVLEIIRQAPAYPEGRGVRLEVRNKRDLADVTTLASMKVVNAAGGRRRH